MRGIKWRERGGKWREATMGEGGKARHFSGPRRRPSPSDLADPFGSKGTNERPIRYHHHSTSFPHLAAKFNRWNFLRLLDRYVLLAASVFRSIPYGITCILTSIGRKGL